MYVMFLQCGVSIHKQQAELYNDTRGLKCKEQMVIISENSMALCASLRPDSVSLVSL